MRVPAEHVYATHYIRLSLEHLQDLSIGKSALFEDPSKRIQVNSSGTFDLSVVRRVRQVKVLLGVGSRLPHPYVPTLPLSLSSISLFPFS